MLVEETDTCVITDYWQNNVTALDQMGDWLSSPPWGFAKDLTEKDLL